MKNRLIILIISLIALSAHSDEKLSFNSFIGRPYKGPIRISFDQFRHYMSLDEVSLEHYATGRSLYIAGSIIGGVGAAFLGANTGVLIAGGEPERDIWAIGGFTTATGIAISSIGVHHFRKGIAIYNSNNYGASLKPHRIEYSGNGVYLTWNF